MELSLAEAAVQLGKTPRQVRYLIKHGRLRATKRAGAWLIDSADLTRSDAQVEAAVNKQAHLRAAVEPSPAHEGRPRNALACLPRSP